MDDGAPLGKWFYIFGWIRRIVAQLLPGWILKKLYPIGKCQDGIIVFCDGVGPEIYINSQRKFAVDHLGLKTLNQLPFPISVDGFLFDLLVNSRSLANVHRVNRITIPSDQIGELPGDTDLTDNQANLLRETPGDCAVLHIQGEIHINCPVGRFKKYVSLNTRGQIHR